MSSTEFFPIRSISVPFHVIVDPINRFLSGSSVFFIAIPGSPPLLFGSSASNWRLTVFGNRVLSLAHLTGFGSFFFCGALPSFSGFRLVAARRGRRHIIKMEANQRQSLRRYTPTESRGEATDEEKKRRPRRRRGPTKKKEKIYMEGNSKKKLTKRKMVGGRHGRHAL